MDPVGERLECDRLHPPDRLFSVDAMGHDPWMRIGWILTMFSVFEEGKALHA